MLVGSTPRVLRLLAAVVSLVVAGVVGLALFVPLAAWRIWRKHRLDCSDEEEVTLAP